MILCVACVVCTMDILLRDCLIKVRDEQCWNIGDEEQQKADNQGYPWRVEPHTAGVENYAFVLHAEYTNSCYINENKFHCCFMEKITDVQHTYVCICLSVWPI